ncbi:tRNA(Met) cytidine acetyltransferase TmcA [Marinobacterium marinum]|uniref:tRNA(Met) cytidine acetyltransferase TmcA n=1 Tax=Marinobacterium marinum TaxID=2756129 RepID=A0A7W1WWV6_9GAMM|nr:GNAT family N-acetyltransferase [Marinobacterium marinum]MBA4501714.1 tRNA(Met) cytidine acetyltransferase [Marinobacterium marinum]
MTELNELRRQLQLSHQRVLIWVSGEAGWCREQLKGPLSMWLQGRGVLVGRDSIAGIPAFEARQVSALLGQTLDFAVVDAFAGFNPNTFGQLCGAVEGGGCVVLLTPSPDEWVRYADPEYAALCVEPYRPDQLRGQYLAHLVRVLGSADERVYWPQAGAPVLPFLPGVEAAGVGVPPCRSQDQVAAVEQVLETAEKRQSPLVLSADRGRGKSAALGIAAARLLQAGKRVVVTAFSREAIGSLLERVEVLAPEVVEQLDYYRPDELLQADVRADLLLVDEAAAIPTPLLSRLLERYPRAVFATTLHGYEGNGQGFALRFLQQLRNRYPRCREYRLYTPIRWSAPDPLERLSHRMLLLDVDVGDLTDTEGEPAVVRLTQADLAQNTEQLRQLFGLLVLAHYRTTPGDLRILLDSPNMRVYQISTRGVPVACALVAEEGPLPVELAQSVWQGRRRPRGHLLPQTLIAQEGWLEAAPWRALRIVRIAVHPSMRERGIGRRVLQSIEQEARAEGVDYLGASFAASEALLGFWQRSGFCPVRLGEQRDPVAGTHALLVLKALTARVEDWLPQAQCWYRRSVLQRVPGTLRDLEAERLPALLRMTVRERVVPLATMQRLRGFSEAQRSLESSLLPLCDLIEASVQDWDDWQLSVSDQRLLCDRILRQLPPAAVVEPAGKKAQLARLRLLCGLLLLRLSAKSPSIP